MEKRRYSYQRYEEMAVKGGCFVFVIPIYKTSIVSKRKPTEVIEYLKQHIETEHQSATEKYFIGNIDNYGFTITRSHARIRAIRAPKSKIYIKGIIGEHPPGSIVNLVIGPHWSITITFPLLPLFIILGGIVYPKSGQDELFFIAAVITIFDAILYLLDGYEAKKALYIILNRGLDNG